MRLCSVLWTVVGLGLVGVGGSALAGGKNFDPVWINTSIRSAGGGLGDARNSSDSAQAIGCTVQGYSGANSAYSVVVCYAQDVKRTMVSCYSSDATLRQTAAAINGDSYVTFNWDANGLCTMIQTSNESTYSPKQP